MACARCFEGSAEQAWSALRGLTRERVVVEEPHLSVVICACACGQRFVDVFCERIDWQGGQDPQEWLVVPVSDEEAAAMKSERDIPAIEPKRRCLVVRHFEGPKQILFQHGPFGIAPHD
jgi:hypothetical protein